MDDSARHGMIGKTYETWDAMRTDIGQEVAVSDWVVVTQDMIQKFAESTGDHQWIHVDVERALRESPYKMPIAHGLLTLALLPNLRASCFGFPVARQTLNYGFDRVRFTSVVPVGSRLRARFRIVAVDEARGGYLTRLGVVIERDGQEKPVLVTDWTNWRSSG